MAASESQPEKKILVAFDFDHTLIDENSDLYILKLAPDGKLPGHIQELYNTQGWNEYMGAIFKYLFDKGTTPAQMLACMCEIPFVDGMVKLLKHLASEQYHVIVISDSNSVFIDCILEAAKLDHVVESVYTNPAKFDAAGCLKIEYYHLQDWCDLSTVNMCKGHILREHVREAAERGLQYPVVAYVGDGSNDLCPSLHLTDKDYVFPRRKYQLIAKIAQLRERRIKAEVVPWDTGDEILQVLRDLKV